MNKPYPKLCLPTVVPDQYCSLGSSVRTPWIGGQKMLLSHHVVNQTTHLVSYLMKIHIQIYTQQSMTSIPE